MKKRKTPASTGPRDLYDEPDHIVKSLSTGKSHLVLPNGTVRYDVSVYVDLNQYVQTKQQPAKGFAYFDRIPVI